MSWHRDDLFNKGTVFLGRALEVERHSPLYPFWATLALEQFCRAVLANVHSALLADPQDGESLLYVFGLAPAGRSIPFKTVVSRCQRIMPTLSKADADFALSLMERRNAELHTGESSFEGLDPGMWENRLFRLLQQLHTQLGESLEDSVGVEHAKVVKAIISADRDAVEGEVKKRVSICKSHFELKSADEIRALRDAASNLMTNAIHRRVPCPACGSSALIQGENQLTKQPVLKDDVLVVETICLPIDLTCACCELHLEGNAQLVAAGCGGTFPSVEEYDALEHYGQQYVEMEAADYEYGND